MIWITTISTTEPVSRGSNCALIFSLLLANMLIFSGPASGLDPVGRNAAAPPQTPGFILDKSISAYNSLSTLNQELVLTQSASLTLQTWCKQKNPTLEISLTAKQVRVPPKPATQTIRKLLKVGPEELIRFRHVLLNCGSQTFSEADNWYVPSRLEREMNWALDNSLTPFGVAVRSLSPTRMNLSSEVFPHSDDKTSKLTTIRRDSPDEEQQSQIILRHRAVLQTQKGPLCLVEEHYFEEMLTPPQEVPRR